MGIYSLIYDLRGILNKKPYRSIVGYFFINRMTYREYRGGDLMKKIFDLPDMLSVKHVQEYLNISKSTVYRIFKDKSFPSVTIGGVKRIKKDDFLNWLESQKEAK